MAELIITLFVAFLIVFFIARKVIDRETFKKLRFLGITGILVILGFIVLILLKAGR